MKSGYQKTGCFANIFVISIVVLGFIGEVKCFFKVIDCNWEPVGKAEVIYTGALFTGLGVIVGWIDIEDK